MSNYDVMTRAARYPPDEEADYPIWYDGKKINEVLFCEEFLLDHPMLCVRDVFCTTEGRVTDETMLKRRILERIKPYVTSGVAKRAANLLDALRVECWCPSLPVYQNRIHAANGTLFLDGRFYEEKDFCFNRLPVRYISDAPAPATWLTFLDGLLEPDDILTLQEYIGYCLIPSTKGQKMLIITGKGGEGKSRIGVVLRALLGQSMNTGSIAKVETNPFARADLEHQLLLVDDDMKLEALPQTNNIKSIVTAELPMDLEKKGKQSYQGQLYVRFLGLGNGSLNSLYDRSVGFFRRQIILTAKERPEGRVDDPFIAEKMCAEAEGIFLWALEGLRRLIANDYRFTISAQAQENMRAAVADGNNAIEFMRSSGYIAFEPSAAASSRDLYAAYKLWCEDNAYNALSMKSFCNFLGQNAGAYHIEPTNNIYIGNGKRSRGFTGLKVVTRQF